MMKILLIGLGNMGTNHYRLLRKLTATMECELKTCDINLEKKADFGDYKNAIVKFIPTHVVIATTTSTHEEILDFCIGQKIPKVLVEKPIIEGDGSKYLGRMKTDIMVGHTERYNPVVLKLKQLLENRQIDTIVCTRSGLQGDGENYDLHTDLCIHDVDVIQFISRELHRPEKNMTYSRSIKANSCNIFIELNGIDCFLHADTKSPYKRREIKVFGPNYIIEADYIAQKLWENGEECFITKSEPLEIELKAFLTGEYTDLDLHEAVDNLFIVKRG